MMIVKVQDHLEVTTLITRALELCMRKCENPDAVFCLQEGGHPKSTTQSIMLLQTALAAVILLFMVPWTQSIITVINLQLSNSGAAEMAMVYTVTILLSNMFAPQGANTFSRAQYFMKGKSQARSFTMAGAYIPLRCARVPGGMMVIGSTCLTALK